MMKQHTHKYERRRLGSGNMTKPKSGHEIYKCTISGCTHYMIDMEAVVGRYSQCWGKVPGKTHSWEVEDCPNDVEMTRYMVFSEKRKRPICEDCKRERKLRRMSEQEISEMEQRDKAIDKVIKEMKELEEDNATINTKSSAR